MIRNLTFERSKKQGRRILYGDFPYKEIRRLQHVFANIKGRCNKKTWVGYHNYGGRGIKCEWNSFQEFLQDMGNSYNCKNKKKLTLDRINNDGNYCKDNCRWVTHKENMYNTRINKLYTYNNITKPLGKWASEKKMYWGTLRQRIEKYGWAIEKALTTPIRKNKRNKLCKTKI